MRMRVVAYIRTCSSFLSPSYSLDSHSGHNGLPKRVASVFNTGSSKFDL